jgi:hypothetical protein
MSLADEMLLERLIQRLKDSGAWLAAGVAEMAIEVHNEDLEHAGFIRVPTDYAAVLRKANGLQSRAFLLWGTEPTPMAGGAWTSDILDATRKAARSEDGDHHFVVLGRVPPDLQLLYLESNGKYLLREDGSGETLDEFDSFLDFAHTWLEKRKL